MKIAFRADASSWMGTGHVMRCLALAETLRELGAEVLFICRDHADNLISRIESANLRVAVLPCSRDNGGARADYAGWLGVPQSVDAAETIEALGGMPPAWLVVDHYGIDQEWERRLRSHAGKLLVIDDLANRPHDCDILLNQNLIQDASDRYRPLIPAHCETLLGPRFALLRAEFVKERASLNRSTDRVVNLLVFLGGGDPERLILRIVAALTDYPLHGVEVTVVVGAANPRRHTIEKLCRGRPGYRVVGTSNNMARLIVESDLAIGAGGSSTWERCCLGLPTIAVAIAENQQEATETVAQTGACLYLGRSADFCGESFAASLKVMLENSSLRRSMSHAGMALADGLGCRRVARVMLRRPLRVRPARLDDAEQIFTWRNAEQTRRHSHDPRPLFFDQHVAWFKGCLADTERQLLIGESEETQIGVLRYDFTHNVATVSIYLDPAQHGRGWGASLLQAGEEWLRRTKPDVVCVRAEVLYGNEASRTVFAEAGFKDRGVLFEKSLTSLAGTHGA